MKINAVLCEKEKWKGYRHRKKKEKMKRLKLRRQGGLSFYPKKKNKSVKIFSLVVPNVYLLYTKFILRLLL